MSYAKIRPRRGTKTEWELVDPILMEGELGIEFPDTGIGTGLCKFKLGDGKTNWSDLPYAFNAAAASAVYGGTVTTHNDIFLRTGTSDEWEKENPILGLGEVVFDVSRYALKVGDGQHNFRSLKYIGAVDKDYDFGDIDDGEIIYGPDDDDYDFSTNTTDNQ